MSIFSKTKPSGSGGSNANKHEEPAANTPHTATIERARPEMPLAILADLLGLKEFSGCFEDGFLLHGGDFLEDEKEFWDTLSKKAETFVKKIKLTGEKFEADMQLHTYITHDSMTAYGCIFPPVGNGKRLDFDALRAQADSEGIKYGIDDGLLRELVNKGTVLKIFTLAKGKPVRDGVNGQVIDMYSREKKISLESGEHDTIDFKNLNWLQNVHTGDVICKIVQPVQAEDGISVRGIELRGETARMPQLPLGKNVIETDDHTALIAACDGQLNFTCGCFKVEQMLIIENDIDSSTGNLDVIGSVTIGGKVAEGYTVKATEDITVRGNVEGAVLIAGGNVQIKQGMNGNLHGRIEAGKNVTSRYLEYCSVSAGGTVKAESIISSTVVSREKVTVNMGKGMILGSSVLGATGIEVKSVGNERYLMTNLAIGSDPALYSELETLRTEVKELSHKSEENDKNVLYLEKQETLSEKYQQLLETLRANQMAFLTELETKTARIEKLEAELNKEGQILVNQLLPPVTVTIGNTKLVIDTEQHMRRIYKADGEIVLGSK